MVSEPDKDTALTLNDQPMSAWEAAAAMGIDMDVCAPITRENLFRLREAIADLNPWHRMTPEHLPLELNEEIISRLQNLQLATDLGPLDVLSEVIAVGNYATVLSRSIVVKFAFGEMRFLDMDALIATKSHLSGVQDKLAIPELLAIKERLCVKSS